MTTTQINQLIQIANDLGHLVDILSENEYLPIYNAWDQIAHVLELNNINLAEMVHIPEV